MNLKQITAGALSPVNLGTRFVVIDGGNSFVGRLTGLHGYARKNYTTGEVKPSINLEFEGEGTKASLTLRELPPEFVLQVDMEDDDITTEAEPEVDLF